MFRRYVFDGRRGGLWGWGVWEDGVSGVKRTGGSGDGDEERKRRKVNLLSRFVGDCEKCTGCFRGRRGIRKGCVVLSQESWVVQDKQRAWLI